MMQINNQMKRNGLTGSHLKWLAIVAMVIDHTGAFLFDRFKEEQYLKWLIPILGIVLAEVFQTDYASFGILIIFVFYYFRADKELRNPIVGLLLLLQATAIFALIPIQLYNGERGRQNKYFFYLFYPVHLLLFFFIRIILFK